MNKKHLEKKLIINKQTISNLDPHSMNAIHGGAYYPTDRTCYYTYPRHCNTADKSCDACWEYQS